VGTVARFTVCVRDGAAEVKQVKKIDTLEIVIYAAGALILIMMVCSTIAGIYTNPPILSKVVKNTAITTETETHRVRCAEVKDGTCTEYIIFRIVKE
jgi:hypothetical protein